MVLCAEEFFSRNRNSSLFIGLVVNVVIKYEKSMVCLLNGLAILGGEIFMGWYSDRHDD